jgi:hypothetical protein
MTKPEWNALKATDKVTRCWPEQDKATGNWADKRHYGEVIRMSARGMQALVKWDSGYVIWQGRTQIERDC